MSETGKALAVCVGGAAIGLFVTGGNPLGAIAGCLISTMAGCGEEDPYPQLPTANQIRVSVVINDDDFTISQQEIVDTFSMASQSLDEHTGRIYVLKEIIHGNYGRGATRTYGSHISSGYLTQHLKDLPDYLVVFSKDALALRSGAFTITPPFGSGEEEHNLLEQSAQNYCNAVGSPYQPWPVVYEAVVNWQPLIGGCGYELQGEDWVHVRDASFNGQCRNERGLTCVQIPEVPDEWQCPNLIDDPDAGPRIRDRKLEIAGLVNHELMHNFGDGGPRDHVCSEDVSAELQAQSAWQMCGEVINNFNLAQPICIYK
ncbi:MAG: hypothetical protein HY609_03580 [Deltaproteobacteria bacterium]|nr:hypothetical protein [Deltaproteobacteria bacterium]